MKERQKKKEEEKELKKKAAEIEKMKKEAIKSQKLVRSPEKIQRIKDIVDYFELVNKEVSDLEISFGDNLDLNKFSDLKNTTVINYFQPMDSDMRRKNSF